jgi:hypothetical protein
VRTLVYDVDPQTFAPIEGTLTITIPSRPHALRLTSRMHVDAYERIPLTATTARLLRIQTTPRTTVIVHSERSESAGRSHYGSDDGSGASFSPSR